MRQPSVRGRDQPLSDLEGRRRSASCAVRPVLTAAPRIEPFLGTGLPLLPRRTTKNLLETRGCYPDDRQTALSCREFSDCFSFYCFDGRLEPTRRRSEQCDCRASARTAEIEYDDKTLQELVQSVSRSRLKLNRPDPLNHESLSRARGLRDDDCVLGWAHSENHTGTLTELQMRAKLGRIRQFARLGRYLPNSDSLWRSLISVFVNLFRARRCAKACLQAS
jgi:hypothetical protein